MAASLQMLGAVFGLLTGLVTCHSMILGYQLGLWTARVQLQHHVASTSEVLTATADVPVEQ